MHGHYCVSILGANLWHLKMYKCQRVKALTCAISQAVQSDAVCVSGYIYIPVWFGYYYSEYFWIVLINLDNRGLCIFARISRKCTWNFVIGFSERHTNWAGKLAEREHLLIMCAYVIQVCGKDGSKFRPFLRLESPILRYGKLKSCFPQHLNFIALT